MRIVKRPTPRNFRSGKVCLSAEELATITAGDTLVVMKYMEDEVMFTKMITQKMIDSAVNMGDYWLMSYKIA